VSRRPDQVAADIRRAVSEVLGRGLHDERIKGMISVTEVRLAPDLSQATVRVSVLPAEHEQTTLRGLQHAAPRLRAKVSHALRLRRVPRLVFEIDHSLKRAAELDRALAAASDHGDETGGEPE
jgi:ribosome-binding factor A